MSIATLFGVIRNRWKSEIMANEDLSSPTLTSATVSAATSDDSFNDATENLSVFDGYTFINVSGFTEIANNGIYTVKAVTEDKITVVENLADEAVGDTVTIVAALPTIWPNDTTTEVPNNVKHAMVEIEIDSRENIEFGETHRDRIEGNLLARLRVPAAEGTSVSEALADTVVAAFQHTTTSSVKWLTPRVMPIGTVGAFYDTNVICPFWYDETS